MQADKEMRLTLKAPTVLQYVTFWNGIFGMTERELEFLAALMSGEGELCSTMNRSHACASLGVTKAVMNTYVKRLKDKGAIKHDKDIYIVHRIFERNRRVEVLVGWES